MTRQARALIKEGAIGRVRMIDVIFRRRRSRNLSRPGKSRGSPLALPGDVDRQGVDPWRGQFSRLPHGGLRHRAQGQRVSARLATFAKNREVFDNVYATVEFSDGAAGRFWSSYVAAGNDQGFSFVIIGETGQLRWSEEDPNTSG